MMEFRVRPKIATGEAMVEVWDDSQFIAAVYADATSVRVVSKYACSGTFDESPPPKFTVRLDRSQEAGAAAWARPKKTEERPA